jgi:hypothetical protein
VIRATLGNTEAARTTSDGDKGVSEPDRCRSKIGQAA